MVGLDFFKKNYLDKNLIGNLQASEKFLKYQYESFEKHYQEFMLLTQNGRIPSKDEILSGFSFIGFRRSKSLC